MSMNVFGDMAQTQVLSRRHVELKQRISELTQELTTGRVSNVSNRLAGDFSALNDIERNTRLFQGYRTATAEAATFARSMQTVLENIQSTASALGSQLLTSGASNIPQVVESSSRQAVGQLDRLVSSLNTQVAGRVLFGGIATDRAPLIDAQSLLDELGAAIGAATGVADIQTAARDWFTDPSGFSAIAYQGANSGPAALQLGDGEDVSIDVRADNGTFRDLLRDTALAALASDPALDLSSQDRAALISSSGQGLLATGDGLTALRAAVGAVEERIDRSASRNEAAMTGVELAKNALLGVDPYEAATRLEEVQFQLESLYSITVRASQLSLLNYMR